MRISRRAVLSGALGGVAAASLAVITVAAQEGRIRYNATSTDGLRMLEAYARGVAAMKALPGSDPRSWTFQWFTHWVRGDSTKLVQLADYFGDTPSPARDLANIMWSSCQAHGPGMDAYNFLPWHRACLMYFEEIVREMSGVDDFTLPYWDYTTDGVLPQQFRSPGDPLWGVLYVDERRSSVNAGTTITNNSVNLSALANASYYDLGLSTGFNNEVDGGVHGAVHVNVGTPQNMGSVPFAVRDPIFWLHHCNIDRIWAAWNEAGRANPTDATWSGAKHVFADKAGNRVEVTNAEVTGLSALNYSYDLLPPVPVNPSAEVTVLAEGGESIARNSDVVNLAQEGATATLLPISPEAGAGLAALGDARLLLVLDGIVAAEQPGTVFDVYASIPGNAPEEGVYLGSVNFFDAVPLGTDGAKSKRAVFDVTAALTRASLALAGLDALTYYFVPTDDVAPGSLPAIQRVELVKETAAPGG